jgi:hypothetical protein
MRVAAIVIAIVLVAAVLLFEWQYHSMSPSTGAGVAMRMLVKEMLYEYALGNPLPAIGQPRAGTVESFFVDYGDGRDEFYRDGQDPPQDLLDRLGRSGWTAKPVSRVGFDEHGAVTDPETGRMSCVLRVRILRCLGRSAVEVECEAWHGSEAGSLLRGVVRWLPKERLGGPGAALHTGVPLREGPGGGMWTFWVQQTMNT